MSTSTPTTMAKGATQPSLCSWTQPITTGPVAARQYPVVWMTAVVRRFWSTDSERRMTRVNRAAKKAPCAMPENMQGTSQ